jgi:superfamily II DNA or RNA helicase/HKD family nuclease
VHEWLDEQLQEAVGHTHRAHRGPPFRYTRRMGANTRGLYETLITEALETSLAQVPTNLEVQRSPLHEAEAADRIAMHLGGVVERAIAAVEQGDRVKVGTALARALVDVIVATTKATALGTERPLDTASVLRCVLARLPDGRPETIETPLIPLLDTALLTNSPGEPRVGAQVLTEIQSADRIAILMAFIRRTGIRPMLEALRLHVGAGRSLRILTTTYTNSTEAEALDELAKIGADIRVSYDTENTRLHAKAWLFHRHSGFSTAYIGSSNLTYSAQITGLEWNVRVSGARNGSVVDKMSAVFESYWNSGDFVPYRREEFLARTETTNARGHTTLSPIELRPEPFQEHMLEQLALGRLQGRHKNLLVSATGTGKTVMAALDYLRLREELPRSRLLFIAHREEILTQTLATFRHAIRDHAFGEFWVGGQRPQRFEHVFASIQSLSANGLADLDPAHFDVVIVDEFHHAAADTYQAVLAHLRPVELLGLTATPERSDGLPILDWFDGRIAAELRLWDAIDQHRLVPFTYYGIHDGVDLRQIPWRRGRGYDAEGLSNLLTGNNAWAHLVLHEVTKRVDNVARMRALGFCVSVEHARFMARVFSAKGVVSTAIWSDTPTREREQALRDLAERRVNVVFSVDLFNEGVDVPAVDTLLMLRPTDSPTLFLQQLGRGLRRHPQKNVCTVLDFVGQHRTEFRFERRFRALLGGGRSEVAAQIEQGFPFLPAGCHMELDTKTKEIVLQSIRDAVPSRWTAKADELRSLAAKEPTLSLRGFLAKSGLDLDDVYTGAKCWSDLREDAGLHTLPKGPHEEALRRACGRLLHVDDQARLDTYRRLLSMPVAPTISSLSSADQRSLRMLVASLVDKSVPKTASLADGCGAVWAHPQVCAELLELFDLLSQRIEHLPKSLSGHKGVPLVIHARYTRLEILAAFGVGEGAKVAPWQTGVYWAKDANSDLLAFTLDKTSGQFSPTTRYRDYAISRDLIHWESQSVTRAHSETGLRYQHHVAQSSHIMLFARLRSDERAFYFLGPATYVSHESELPMALTWRLEHPLPGDLYASFAAVVA